MPSRSPKKQSRNRQTRKLRKRKTPSRKAIHKTPIQQTGGNQQMNSDTLQKILNTASFAQIKSDAAKAIPVPTIEEVQTEYNKNPSAYLVDIIYDLPAGGTVESVLSSNTQPAIGWDHKTNDPNSITGGRPGIHIYMTGSSPDADNWKLLGVFVRK